MGRLQEIVFDCRNAPALAHFWAGLLDGYAVRAYDEAEIARLAALGLTPATDPTVMVDGPGPSLCFQQVPGRNYQANRIHLDIAIDSRTIAEAEVLRLGGSVMRAEVGYVVMCDPEGNQFCLVERASRSEGPKA